MKLRNLKLPVFALEAATMWSDLEKVAKGVVDYEADELGHTLPLILFSLMTTPANPNRMEPMQTPPENLFIISIERPMDALVRKAAKQARTVLGVKDPASESTGVTINGELPLANVIEQMQKLGVQIDWTTSRDKNHASFFFLCGNAAVEAFGDALWDVADLRF